MEEIQVFRYILLTFVNYQWTKLLHFFSLNLHCFSKSTLLFEIPNREVVKKRGQQRSTVSVSEKNPVFLQLPYMVNFQATVIVRANDTNKWVSDIQVRTFGFGHF